jgi:intergrase/recombinase
MFFIGFITFYKFYITDNFMKLKSFKKKKEKFIPTIQDYVKLINCLIDDIKDCDTTYSKYIEYEGIISERTAPLLKKLFPKIYEELDLKE